MLAGQDGAATLERVQKAFLIPEKIKGLRSNVLLTMRGAVHDPPSLEVMQVV